MCTSIWKRAWESRLLLSLRGGNDVKLKDIIDLRKYMNTHTNMFNSHIAKMDPLAAFP